MILTESNGSFLKNAGNTSIYKVFRFYFIVFLYSFGEIKFNLKPMKNLIRDIINLAIFSFLMILIIFSSSCVPQKKIILVQKKIKNDTTETFVLKTRPKNSIQPFDNIYIKVISPDVITSGMLNSESGSAAGGVTDYNMISYTVNDSGYISFPYVGQIKLLDLTILQARDSIESALSKYISNATIIVKFVGKSFTVVGEVRGQGKYIIYDDNVNIFTAISMAGGLTEYGDREHVTVIRENNGTASYHYVDLTDRNVLTSDFYYLKPEDIIIVQPLKQKSYGFTSFPYAMVLSSFTTIIAILSFMRTY
jgi:polysaccharide biosynthesis/export protein